MCNDSDQELSDLDIESKTWNKLEKNMKLFGFREGAAKGRDLSLQQGFNLGYLDGFKLGEYLGTVRGVLSCQKELGVSTEEGLSSKRDLAELSDQVCVLCLQEKNDRIPISEQFHLRNFEQAQSAQQSHSNKITNCLEKSDFNLYFQKT